ncbi:MAG: hypothetical protein JWM10_3056 [Myxococcaceae bacterium]|nr:hypothetical protein [Myxococcaceae bacterium]
MSTPHAELEVLLRFGPDTRSIPVAALAAITHHSSVALREALSRLFFALVDPHGKAGRGVLPGNQTEGEPSDVGPHVNVPEEDRNVDGNVRDRVAAHVRATSSLTAEHLATELQDFRSVAYFQRLLAEEPQELVAAALAETLARRPEIHGRPGAYFIGVLRALKRVRRHHLPPYA